MYKTSCILIKSKVSIISTLEFRSLILNLNFTRETTFFHFLNAFQKWYILTEFWSFLCFSYFWIKTKHQIRLLALGFEPRHTSRCLHILTRGCSANWTIPTCQNLSFLRKVCKIWNETRLVSFSLLKRFALKKGPPLYQLYFNLWSLPISKQFSKQLTTEQKQHMFNKKVFLKTV